MTLVNLIWLSGSLLVITGGLLSPVSSSLSFFERIAKTYHREKWYPMLRPLLSTWYACAQQLGDVEISVKLLVEQLGQGYSHLLALFFVIEEAIDVLGAEDPNSIEEDLLSILKVRFVFVDQFKC
jgi:trafficking protein particle complex subunit 11